MSIDIKKYKEQINILVNDIKLFSDKYVAYDAKEKDLMEELHPQFETWIKATKATKPLATTVQIPQNQYDEAIAQFEQKFELNYKKELKKVQDRKKLSAIKIKNAKQDLAKIQEEMKKALSKEELAAPFKNIFDIIATDTSSTQGLLDFLKKCAGLKKLPTDILKENKEQLKEINSKVDKNILIADASKEAGTQLNEELRGDGNVLEWIRTLSSDMNVLQSQIVEKLNNWLKTIEQTALMAEKAEEEIKVLKNKQKQAMEDDIAWINTLTTIGGFLLTVAGGGLGALTTLTSKFLTGPIIKSSAKLQTIAKIATGKTGEKAVDEAVGAIAYKWAAELNGAIQKEITSLDKLSAETNQKLNNLALGGAFTTMLEQKIKARTTIAAPLVNLNQLHDSINKFTRHLVNHNELRTHPTSIEIYKELNQTYHILKGSLSKINPPKIKDMGQLQKDFLHGAICDWLPNVLDDSEFKVNFGLPNGQTFKTKKEAEQFAENLFGKDYKKNPLAKITKDVDYFWVLHEDLKKELADMGVPKKILDWGDGYDLDGDQPKQIIAKLKSFKDTKYTKNMWEKILG